MGSGSVAEKPEKVADWHHANIHALVCHSLILFPDPLQTSSTVLLLLFLVIWLLLPHVISTCCLADATLWVVHTQHIYQ